MVAVDVTVVRVPEHEGLVILNTSPQASYVPMYILRPEKVIHSFMNNNEMLTLGLLLICLQAEMCIYIYIYIYVCATERLTS